VLFKTDLDVSVFGVDEGLNENIGPAGREALLDSALSEAAPPPKVLEFFNGEVWLLPKGDDIVPELVVLFVLVLVFPLPKVLRLPNVDEDGAFAVVPKADTLPNPPKVVWGVSAADLVPACALPNGDELNPVDPNPP